MRNSGGNPWREIFGQFAGSICSQNEMEKFAGCAIFDKSWSIHNKFIFPLKNNSLFRMKK